MPNPDYSNESHKQPDDYLDRFVTGRAALGIAFVWGFCLLIAALVHQLRKSRNSESGFQQLPVSYLAPSTTREAA